MSKPNNGSASVALVYRVVRCVLRTPAGDIKSGFKIEGRRLSAKQWLPVTVDGHRLLYYDEAKAYRHCRWLNSPGDTEMEWGADEAPNSDAEADSTVIPT